GKRDLVLDPQFRKGCNQHPNCTRIPRHHQRVQSHEGSLEAAPSAVKVTAVIRDGLPEVAANSLKILDNMRDWKQPSQAEPCTESLGWDLRNPPRVICSGL